MKKTAIIIIFFILYISSVVRAQYANLQVKEAFDKSMINNEHSFARSQADSLNNLDSNKVKLKRHTLFFELGGTCIYYSIKYDYILKQWKKFSINADIGFSILPYIYPYREIRLPMQLSGLYGKNKSKLEFGVFILPLAQIPNKKERKNQGLTTEYVFDRGIAVGYRYQKKPGGLFFKAYFLAFRLDDGYSHATNNYSYSLPWIGIGIGHTFK